MNTSVLSALQAGKAVIVNTDTVIGLAALPTREGYEHIFALKQRPADQVLPWLVADVDALYELSEDLPEYASRLANMFWPGALTLVVRASERAAAYGQIAPDHTVALRCPDDEALRGIIDTLSSPLACTSANLHDQPVPHAIEELPCKMRELAGYSELHANTLSCTASTIVDCTGPFPKILREGPIPEQTVFDVACFGATL